MIHQNKKWKQAITPSAVLPGAFAFAVFTALGWLFPYAMDDWNWGSRTLAEAWQTRLQFDALNGRYLGNFFGVLLGQQRLLRALAVGLTMAFLVWFVPKLAGCKQSGGLFVLVFLLGMSHLKFREGVSYSSGFANYTLPLLLILPLIHFFVPAAQLDRAADQPLDANPRPAPKPSFGPAIALAPMAFASMFFAEHYTVYLCALLACANLYVWVRQKRFDWPLALVALAGLAGALLMFSNPNYRAAFSSSPQYQAAQVQSLRDLVLSVYNGWFNPDWGLAASLLMRETALSLVLAALLLVLLLRARPKGYKLCAGGIGLFAAWQIAMALLPSGVTALGTPFQAAYYYTQGALCVLFFLCAGAALWHIKALRARAFFLLGSVAVISAPLLLVRPVGQRNFMLPYLLLVALALLLIQHLNAISTQNPCQSTAKRLSRAAGAIAGILSVALLVLFSFAYQAEQRRNREVAQQATQAVIQITPPQDWELLYTMPWRPDGAGWPWQEHFDAYYGLPPGTVIAPRP